MTQLQRTLGGEWSEPVNIRPGAGWIDPCPFGMMMAMHILLQVLQRAVSDIRVFFICCKDAA